MKSLAVLLALVISAIAASTASAITRSHAGALPGQGLSTGPACTASPEAAVASGELPLVRPGEVWIENEPGVYVVPCGGSAAATSSATARPASLEPAASSGELPLVRPGEVWIENEPGVYISPRAVPARQRQRRPHGR